MAVAVKVYVPATVGVPDNTPAVLSDIPGGKPEAGCIHENDAADPPRTESETGSGWLRKPQIHSLVSGASQSGACEDRRSGRASNFGRRVDTNR